MSGYDSMRTVTLAVLVIFVCISVIFGVFLVVRATMFLFPYSLMRFPLVIDVLRVLFALLLAYSWFLAWKVITDWYFWRSISVIRGRDES
ncbi:MAG TPA: hypothetical protein VED24_02450 [Candidatus Acidoferrum sp.]|nr:hypothetical protein [Candidatus Acidoferrum sp.]